MKWIEVNIERPLESSKDNYLNNLVRPVLDKFRAQVETWHFLWEGKPWSSTLRLRFYGDDEKIDQLHQFLEETLKDIRHCYGEHGDCGDGKAYGGEADSWGNKAWKNGVSFLELGAEFALELIENKSILGNSDEYKRDAFFYADRYTHLFLNQISSLLEEADFYLLQGVFRYAFQKGKTLSPGETRAIVEEVKQEINS